MKKIKCDKCGNDKRFYLECSVPAKIEYNPYTYEHGDIFDIDREGETDNIFETVYCRECSSEVEVD